MFRGTPTGVGLSLGLLNPIDASKSEHNVIAQIGNVEVLDQEV
jgi:hypothetical protein